MKASFTHGTRYGYQKKKCRCRKCVQWKKSEADRYAEARASRAKAKGA